MIIMALLMRHNQKNVPEESAAPETGTRAVVHFDEIAQRYDLLNLILSAGFDRLWRRAAVRLLGNVSGRRCLDAATGTGRIAKLLARRGGRVTGIDISRDMLRIARSGIKETFCADTVFLEADCERLPFYDGSFDAAVIGFGIRNMPHPGRALGELFRVLKSGAPLVVLEFSRPRCRVVRFFFDIYFFRVLPLVGRAVSGHRFAYSYLPASVAGFAQGEAFAEMLRGAGFADVMVRPLTFGIASLYRGSRP